MTLTAFIVSLLWVLTLVLAFSLFLQVIELKARVKLLKADQKFLDQQITDLTKQVHKNQHNIEYIQNLNQQASVSKQLIKG